MKKRILFMLVLAVFCSMLNIGTIKANASNYNSFGGVDIGNNDYTVNSGDINNNFIISLKTSCAHSNCSEQAVTNGLCEGCIALTSDDGTCSKCGYGPKKSSARTGNVRISIPELEVTEADIYAQKMAQREANMEKKVLTSEGTILHTTIPGIYEAFSLNGVAITMPREDVKRSIGLTEEQIGAGTNASIYISDYLGKEDREYFLGLASETKSGIISMGVADMYSITSDGTISSVNKTPEKITMVFGLSGSAKDMDTEFYVRWLEADGNYTDTQDIDNDPKTVTVNTDTFGKYAIMHSFGVDYNF